MAAITLLFMLLLGYGTISCASTFNVDCSTYASDKLIIQSLPFRIFINPSPSTSMFYSYATVNNQGRVIELSLYRVESIPLSIFCLSSLQSLSLQYSTNFSIPPEIILVKSTLKSLKLLNISDVLILPPELFNVTYLSTLSIISCGLKTLPETIGQMSLLSTLTLTSNSLTSLPASLANMWSLRSLTVSNNVRLSSLDALSGSSSLVQLNASNCAIDHLPSNISMLTSIDMSSNYLSSLDGIDTLVWLECDSFLFNNNKITALPDVIGRVGKLKKLDLSDNLLTELSEAVYHITLGAINLRNNKFDEKESEWIQGRFRTTGTIVNM